MNFEKMTNQLKETLDSAASLALHSQNQEITLSHMIWAMLTNSQSILNQALNKMNVANDAIVLEAKSIVERAPKSSSLSKENLTLSREFAQAIERAQGYSVQNGDSYIALDSFIIANIKEEAFKQILGKYVDLNELKKTLEAIRGGAKIQNQNDDSNLESLEKFGIDSHAKSKPKCP